MYKNETINAKHLYSRAGFGMHFPSLEKRSKLSINLLVDELFEDSAKIDLIEQVEKPQSQQEFRLLSPEQRREYQRMVREQIRDLNVNFLDRLSISKAVLREKMTLFLHGHFACRSPQNPYSLQKLNNIQRTHALGNFKTLTKEVAQSQAMLSFLNNQQNKKGSPNENFARELMELFTLGRGNYTEQGVKESARAFTGWQFNGEGNFEFRPRAHDDGEKTFFGETSNFNGDDILKLIFEKKEAAYFITRKIYLFFVNEVPNEKHIKELGDYFYSKNYELEPLLRKIFTADWFYDKKNIGNKIKSPIELLAGLNKQFYIKYKNPAVLIRFQQGLGQTLFFPPNVSGWTGGKDYIDSSTLMFRLKIPATVINDGLIDFEGKPDPDDEAFLAQSQKQSKAVAQRIKSIVNWGKFAEEIPDTISNMALANFLLQPNVSSKLLSEISNSTDLKSKVVQLISTPEYQLC